MEVQPVSISGVAASPDAPVLPRSRATVVDLPHTSRHSLHCPTVALPLSGSCSLPSLCIHCIPQAVSVALVGNELPRLVGTYLPKLHPHPDPSCSVQIPH